VGEDEISNRDRGIKVAVVGGVVGALAGVVAIGGLVTLLLVAIFGMPSSGLDGFAFWLFAVAAWFIGAYVGLALGCWRALRRNHYPGDARTARWAVLFAFSAWLVSGPASAAGESLGLGVVAVGFGTWLIAFVASPALARLVVLRSMQQERAAPPIEICY
jgi:hypothetical protein